MTNKPKDEQAKKKKKSNNYMTNKPKDEQILGVNTVM